MKNFFLGLALLTFLIFSVGNVYAVTQSGPSQQVGDATCYTQTVINTSPNITGKGVSSATKYITRIGGNTYAIREYCAQTIRQNNNIGGWVGYNTSYSETGTASLNWQDYCYGQAAGSYAIHDFVNGQSWAPVFESAKFPK